MEKVKHYKYIILIVLFASGLAFYWYQYRPSQIRKQCIFVANASADKLIDHMQKTEDLKMSITGVTEDTYLQKVDRHQKEFENRYAECLNKNGLEK